MLAPGGLKSGSGMRSKFRARFKALLVWRGVVGLDLEIHTPANSHLADAVSAYTNSPRIHAAIEPQHN